jgi:hypothetical protein
VIPSQTVKNPRDRLSAQRRRRGELLLRQLDHRLLTLGCLVYEKVADLLDG